MAQTNAQVIQIKGKTEQRVTAVLSVMRESRKASGLTYEDLKDRTGMPYDALLYVLSTLIELGYVERLDVPEGPGRPRVFFRWIFSESARVGGTR
jgi:DNA-binding transcriptional ArsR family regulator